MQYNKQNTDNMFQAVFEGIQAPICIIDKNRKIVCCNNSMKTFARLQEQSIAGQISCDILHNNPKPVSECAVLCCFKSHKEELHEFKFNNKYYLETAYPLYNARGEIYRVIQMFIDVTGAKDNESELRKSEENYRTLFEYKAQLALLENEERYRALFESSSDALVQFEENNLKIIDINESSVQLYGYSRSEMLDMHVTDLSAEADNTGQLKIEFLRPKEINSDSRTSMGLQYHRRKDGTVFPVEITSSRIQLRDKVVNLFSIRDITKRHKAQEELFAKNIALKELIAQVENEKRQIKDEFHANLSVVITPIIERMQSDKLTEGYARLLESSLATITSAYGFNISKRAPQLTQREIEICTMIKSGLSTKDIAHLLNRSIQTVEKQRKIIRKKLNIKGKSSNLSSFLKNLVHTNPH